MSNIHDDNLKESLAAYYGAIEIINAHEDRARVEPRTVLHLNRALQVVRDVGDYDMLEGLEARIRTFALQAIAAGAKNPHLLAQAALASADIVTPMS